MTTDNGPADEQAGFPHAVHTWRQGRHVDNHVYEQHGPEPSDTDQWIGSFPRPGDAEIAVTAVNAVRAGFCGETDVLRYERDGARAEVERLRGRTHEIQAQEMAKRADLDKHLAEWQARWELGKSWWDDASESTRDWHVTSYVGRAAVMRLVTERDEARAASERLRAEKADHRCDIGSALDAILPGHDVRAEFDDDEPAAVPSSDQPEPSGEFDEPEVCPCHHASLWLCPDTPARKHRKRAGGLRAGRGTSLGATDAAAS